MFFDPGHRRRRLLTFVTTALLTFVVAWLAIFGSRLYLVEKLPYPATVSAALGPGAGAVGLPRPDVAATVNNSCDYSPFPRLLPGAGDPQLRQMPTDRVFAFLPYLPETAPVSLIAGSRAIDVLMPEWFRVRDVAAGVELLNREAEHQVALQRFLDHSLTPMQLVPVITVEHGAMPPGRDGHAARAALASRLADMALAAGYTGLGLLPEGIDTDELPRFADFAMLLDAALNARGLRSHLLDSVDSLLLADAELMQAMDRVVLKLFEEPWIGTPPGPLADGAWLEDRASWALETLGPEKLVFMLGSFAVDWSREAAAPRQITVADAFLRLSEHGGTLDFPGGAGNMRIRYRDAGGGAHEIWALDAVSLFNQLARLSDLGQRRVGLWSLGFEDPSAWPLFAARVLSPDTAAQFIARVDFSDFVSYSGAGPFQRLVAPAAVGERIIGTDPETGLFAEQAFSALPLPWAIERYGQAAPEMVAITFDDGPNPAYTEPILDILRDREAPATFFVVGSQVLRAPDTLRRILAEGHAIGSHTFLHLPMDARTLPRSQIELGALQRLLVAVDGRGTLLFRTPYGRSEGPMTGQDAAPMRVLADAGYVVVGSDVVPPDWRGLSAPQIVDYAMNDLAANGGNVIVLHDAGGDRKATVDALGPLIDRLRADGYRIVGLDEMLGVSRDVLMPPASGTSVMLDQASFALIGGASAWVATLFWLLVAAGTLRALTVLGLALSRRRHAPDFGAYAPPITVVIPAFNEEATILRCLDSILAANYLDVQIIVVDDGSTDHTCENVAARSRTHPNIHIVREPNMGKWQALDTAYNLIETEIVVAIDADSMVGRDSLGWLVRHFADPRVGAVAGRVCVGNRRGLLTRLQVLEYLTAQSIERRAFERLNAMLVVPGAIGAWRRQAVRDAGLYSSQTLTEDADLTASVIRAGYRVVYEEHAFAVTEVPERIGPFLRQRLRWSFGLLQTAFKHLPGALRERRALGWVTLPDLLLVGYGFSLLAPFVDLVLLATLADLAVDAIASHPTPLSDIRLQLVLGYALLPLFDVILILIALRIDRSESFWLVLLFPLQRFFYRQLIYLSALRAVFRAATGSLAHWGKLIRTGNARLTPTG